MVSRPPGDAPGAYIFDLASPEQPSADPDHPIGLAPADRARQGTQIEYRGAQTGGGKMIQITIIIFIIIPYYHKLSVGERYLSTLSCAPRGDSGACIFDLVPLKLPPTDPGHRRALAPSGRVRRGAKIEYRGSEIQGGG